MSERHTDKKPEAVLKWTGTFRKSGAPERYFVGVPTRDLTADDIAGLDKETAAALVSSGLYKPATAPKPSAAKE